MPNLSPESLNWLDKLAALNAQLEKTPDATHGELAQDLKTSRAMVTLLSALKPLFDLAAIGKIRQAYSNNGYIFSLSNARNLTRLNQRVSDLPAAVHAALKVILTQRLAPKQTKALVAWMIVGKPAGEFNAQVHTPKTAPSKPQNSSVHPPLGISSQRKSQKNPLLDKVTQLVQRYEAEKERGDGQTIAQAKLTAYLESLSASPRGISSLPSPSSRRAARAQQNANPSLLLEWLAGISIFTQLKSKIKKGQKLSTGDKLLLAARALGQVLRWIWKDGLKTVLKVVKIIWHIVIDALKTLGLYRYVRAVFVLAALVLLVWLAWAVYFHRAYWPYEVVKGKFFSVFARSNQPTPFPTPEPTPSPAGTTASASAAPAPSRLAHRPADSQPVQVAPMQAWVAPSADSASLGEVDQKYLEMEIAAIPENTLVKPFLYTPVAMTPDMATRRLADLQDSERYSVWFGNDHEKVTSLVPSPSNCVLNFQPALINPFGGPTQMEFYWEDVKAIHCSELGVIDPHSYYANGDHKGPLAQPPSDNNSLGQPNRVTRPDASQQVNSTTRLVGSRQVVYQISLVLSESKKPLTIQCNSVAELGHLVSALEFWLKSTRGTTAPLIGLPYLYQGLWLKGGQQISILWANSPADKAGVKLADQLWSVGKNTPSQQGQSDMEKALPTADTLWVVGPAELQKAKAELMANHTNILMPKRRALKLQ